MKTRLCPQLGGSLIACWETLDTVARDWRTAAQSTGAVASIETVPGIDRHGAGIGELLTSDPEFRDWLLRE